METALVGFKLKERHKEQIRAYMADDRKLLLALAYGETQRRQSARARQIVANAHQYFREKLLTKIKSMPQDVQESLKKIICNDFEYCKKKKSCEFIYTVINGIIGVADKFWLHISEGAASALAQIVFVIKKRLLDNLCECA